MRCPPVVEAMRFAPPDEAKALRRAERSRELGAGLLIALFVSIPIVNLATPLFAMAMMVHVRKADRRTTGRVVPAEAGVNRRRSGGSTRSSAGRRR